DPLVTGVQTCALPILMRVEAPRTAVERMRWIFQGCGDVLDRLRGRGEPNPISEAADRLGTSMLAFAAFALGGLDVAQNPELLFRSEERRVGKGGRCAG